METVGDSYSLTLKARMINFWASCYVLSPYLGRMSLLLPFCGLILMKPLLLFV